MDASTQKISGRRVLRILLLIVATASFVPMSIWFYWLAFALHGKEDLVYYELGKIAEYAITSFIGVLTAILFLAAALAWNRWAGRLYLGFAATLFLANLVFSLLDCYT